MSLARKTIRNSLFDRASAAPLVVSTHDFRKEFVCPEELTRYASSLAQLVFNKFRNDRSNPTIIEFGSGTGEPVISAILNSKFSGTVYGYEINPEVSETADRLIEKHGLSKKYIVCNASFFETRRIPPSDYLIANPPYLPCEDKKLLILPYLCGGKEGNEPSKKLLSLGYKNVFLEVSSYSNPAALIEYALSLGYIVSDFLITQMPLGVYSRQDVVQKRIHEMKKEGKAFFTNNCYLVGSALFTKTGNRETDLSDEFRKCLCSLGS